MVNFRAVSGYDIEQGRVPNKKLPQYFGLVHLGEHYLVSQNDYDDAINRKRFVGKLEGNEIVDKIILPNKIYHVNSVSSDGTLKTVRVYEDKLIIDVIRNGKSPFEIEMEKLQKAA